MAPTPASTTSDSALWLHSTPELKPALSEMLVGIRSAFGFGVSRLAGVLRVERPTVYAWLGSKNEPRGGNKDRIKAIWELSQHWASSGLPADVEALDRVVVDERTIGDLLADDPLRSSVIRNAIDHLASATTPASARGRKGRELAERFGGAESPGAVAQLDVVMGRPFSDDL